MAPAWVRRRTRSSSQPGRGNEGKWVDRCPRQRHQVSHRSSRQRGCAPASRSRAGPARTDRLAARRSWWLTGPGPTEGPPSCHCLRSARRLRCHPLLRSCSRRWPSAVHRSGCRAGPLSHERRGWPSRPVHQRSRPGRLGSGQRPSRRGSAPTRGNECHQARGWSARSAMACGQPERRAGSAPERALQRSSRPGRP